MLSLRPEQQRLFPLSCSWDPEDQINACTFFRGVGVGKLAATGRGRGLQTVAHRVSYGRAGPHTLSPLQRKVFGVEGFSWGAVTFRAACPALEECGVHRGRPACEESHYDSACGQMPPGMAEVLWGATSYLPFRQGRWGSCRKSRGWPGDWREGRGWGKERGGGSDKSEWERRGLNRAEKEQPGSPAWILRAGEAGGRFNKTGHSLR